MEDKKKNNRNLIAVFSLIIAIVVGILVLILWANMTENRFKIFRLENEMRPKNSIDFTSNRVQSIGNGFFVVKLEMEEHLSGIKFSGRVINTQSIRHHNIEIKISADGHEKNLTINMISSGNSTKFSVYIPDIEPNNAHYGSIKYINSTYEYSVN